MRLFFIAPVALGALMLGSGCGSTAAPAPAAMASASGPDQCFSPDRISNYASADDKTLYVRAFDRTVYELDTTGACFDLSTATTIAVRSFGGASRLCLGDTAEITAPGNFGTTQMCRAQVSRTLNDEQVAALPRRARP
jgi:hypothetical protein